MVYNQQKNSPRFIFRNGMGEPNWLARTVFPMSGRRSQDILEAARFTESMARIDHMPIATREVDRQNPEIVSVRVLINGVEDEVASEAYRDQLLTRATNDLATFSFYDFANYPEVGTALDQAMQLGRAHIAAKLERLGLEGVLLPYPYFVRYDPDPNGGIGTNGYVDPESGLTVIIVNDFSLDLLLSTAIIGAHETSHSSTGLTIERNDNQPDVVRGGHQRNQGENVLAGAMLENASAIMDSAEAYRQIKRIPFFQKAVLERERVVATATRKAVRQARKHHENDRMISRIVSAKKLGIPAYLLEASISYVGNGNMDQLVALWKIGRIIGRDICDREGRIPNPSEYFAIGYDFLETSRYAQNPTAIERIRELLGEEADIIINAGHTPNRVDNKEMEKVLAAIKRVEQRMELALEMNPKQGDFELY